MKQLKFSNPVFHKGVNLTVRKGTKWSGESGDVSLADQDGTIVATGRIRNTTAIKFFDLRKINLEKEHDPKCRKYDGLLEEMINIYKYFYEHEIVTLIWFELLNSDKNDKPSVARKAK